MTASGARIIFTRALRSVSDQLSARGNWATSCCDVWGTDAGYTHALQELVSDMREGQGTAQPP
eukprot:651675-Amphidinium_carterae.1